ncbi:MAG: DUF4416 family protein [Planctomycetaceae bacterium]|jgi:hypothetical protein|nr:DUF4416 family protein [Planctomycetaceae bacterium]
MGEIKKVQSVFLIVAVFSSDETSFDWAFEKIESQFGKIIIKSEKFNFDNFTDYYSRSMGENLYKQLWGLQNLIDPSILSDIKLITNQLEKDFINENNSDVSRPLNLDPGYVDLGKLILASTKDHSHRIYLSKGIFAETTLIYRQKKWQPLDWTYPDYQSEICLNFLDQCRTFLKSTRGQFIENL